MLIAVGRESVALQRITYYFALVYGQHITETAVPPSIRQAAVTNFLRNFLLIILSRIALKLTEAFSFDRSALKFIDYITSVNRKTAVISHNLTAVYLIIICGPVKTVRQAHKQQHKAYNKRCYGNEPFYFVVHLSLLSG